MAAADILLLLSLGIIVLWTTRLARSKGLNPWLWGVGAVLLIAVAWTFSRQFLGPVVMAPLIFLLLFRSPLFRRNRATEGTSMPCPRCGAPEPGGLNFCVQCGWDLSRASAEATEGERETATAAPQAVDQGTSEEVIEPVATPEGQRYAPEKPPEERVETPEPEPTVAPEPVLAQEVTETPVESQDAPPVEPAPQPEPAAPPVTPPRERRPLPTPANLTERGISLFNQGRFQEAIDQFTKAIALDPNYREAWERRAEAYGRMGRSERQQADQRRLEAI